MTIFAVKMNASELPTKKLVRASVGPNEGRTSSRIRTTTQYVV